MSHFGVVEDTLFIPMLGRLYASEHCPQILYDGKALELKKNCLPAYRSRTGRASIPCWPPPSDPTIWIEPFRPFWNTVRTA